MRPWEPWGGMRPWKHGAMSHWGPEAWGHEAMGAMGRDGTIEPWSHELLGARGMGP